MVFMSVLGWCNQTALSLFGLLLTFHKSYGVGRNRYWYIENGYINIKTIDLIY